MKSAKLVARCGPMIAGLVVAAAAPGAATTAGAQIARTELHASGFFGGTVTAIAFPPGDSRRMFVGTQWGRISAVVDGVVLPEPVLDLTGQTQIGFESGLLGIAFHPEFASNGKFYVLHTEILGSGGQDAVVEYVVAGDPTSSVVASPASRRRLLQLNTGSLHHGGWIGFGPDGMLYVSVGDGGSMSRPQNLTLLSGKILRIDVDGRDPGLEYAIPPDNPFVAGPPGARAEIWAYGLRNPWRCSFDRDTGELWIGDVGATLAEEVSVIPAGAGGGQNFGWPCFEGFQPGGWSGCQEPVDPVAEFLHASNPGLDVVIGGYVYRGSLIPRLREQYVFSATGVHSFDSTAPVPPGTLLSSLLIAAGGAATFGEDADGELYLGFNDVYRLVAQPCGPADLSAGSLPGVRGYGQPNGVLDNDDFFYFLNELASGNLAVADLTTWAVPGQPGYGVPNGVLNNDDFFYYLGIFAQGC